MLAGLLSLIVFLPGITWGLPSRDVDRFLFVQREPWTGDEIVRLAGTLDADAAADVDRRISTGFLNDTDAERAEIVTRYRLYSQQPDEMLTLRAIASMAARQSPDPQFYTYGGLWVYPVAGLIGIASLVGLIERGDLAFYLDHPEEFAKMYVVMRLYAVFWAALGAGVVCHFVRGMSQRTWLGLAAAGFFALTPAINIAAHEAKPHLPGAVLAMLALVAAARYQRTGQRRDLWLAGLGCGAATGMVMTMTISFLMLPMAWWSRRPRDLRRANLIVSICLGLVVFAITNPFVLLNPSALAENAGNTASHYGTSDVGFWSAVGWLGRVFGPFVYGGAIIGSLGIVLVILYALSGFRSRIRRRHQLLLPMAVLAAASAATFFLTSFGRPPDHVRFVLLGYACGIVGTFGLWKLKRDDHPTTSVWTRPLPIWVGVGLALPFLIALGPWQFVSNAWGRDGRSAAAQAIAEHPMARGVLFIDNDPAPYAVPPFDLWRWRAVKGQLPQMPKGIGLFGDGYVSINRLEIKPPDAMHMGWGVRQFPMYSQRWPAVD